MFAITRKVYDIPVGARWYIVHVEVNSRIKEGKVLVEFKEKWSEKLENGRVARIDVPLDENAPKLMVLIDTDDHDNYLFHLYVDNKPLEEYMADYMRRKGTWEIEKLGAKSKFVYDEEAGHFYFKGVLVATPEKQRTMTGENIIFRVGVNKLILIIDRICSKFGQVAPTCHTFFTYIQTIWYDFLSQSVKRLE